MSGQQGGEDGGDLRFPAMCKLHTGAEKLSGQVYATSSGLRWAGSDESQNISHTWAEITDLKSSKEIAELRLAITARVDAIELSFGDDWTHRDALRAFILDKAPHLAHTQERVQAPQLAHAQEKSGGDKERSSVFSRLSRPVQHDGVKTGEAIWDTNPTGIRHAMKQYATVHKLQVHHSTPRLSVACTRELRNLKSFLTNSSQHLPKTAFVRWLYNQINHNPSPTGSACLLPNTFAPAPALHTELVKAGESAHRARRIVDELQDHAEASVKRLARLAERSERSSASVQVLKVVDRGTVTLTFEDIRVKLNLVHYDKLTELYTRAMSEKHGKGEGGERQGKEHGEGEGRGKVSLDALHADMFCLLERYNSLEDTGFQAALPGCVFDTIRDLFGVKMECFASPLNCRYETFCSLFPDTDLHFGSMGSFLNFHPTSGSFEANPPFVEEVMEQMARHIEELLSRTTDALSFMVFIPGWTDTPAWPVMKNSPYLRLFLTASKGSHGFCVGDQHKNTKRLLPATFETGIFLLQTDAAAAQWPASETAVAALEAALQNSCPALSKRDQSYYTERIERKRVRDERDGRPHAFSDEQYRPKRARQ